MICLIIVHYTLPDLAASREPKYASLATESFMNLKETVDKVRLLRASEPSTLQTLVKLLEALLCSHCAAARNREPRVLELLFVN